MSVPLLQQKNLMGLHRHKMPHIPRILNSLCNATFMEERDCEKMMNIFIFDKERC